MRCTSTGDQLQGSQEPGVSRTEGDPCEGPMMRLGVIGQGTGEAIDLEQV
jgi:hypothetical protein